MRILKFLSFICILSLASCGSTKDSVKKNADNLSQNLNILALGDSYTIGESVCETCRFPVQLQKSLMSKIGSNASISLEIIAKTGWTTSNLINAIQEKNIGTDYDLVTLLIGVNNQYQGKPFSLYEEEFPILLSKAIQKAKGNPLNVIVVSIPDYAFTPFGQGKTNAKIISTEINQYNSFAKAHSEENGVAFINITDITRNGLTRPNLVASDGLHPSENAYSEFVKRLLPVALEKIR